MKFLKRLEGLFFKPRETWEAIKKERTTILKLFLGWVMPLACIHLATSVLIATIFMFREPLLTETFLVKKLALAILDYVSGLFAVYINAVVISIVAPLFNAKKNLVNAVKLVAYSSTPFWFVSVLSIIPVLIPAAEIIYLGALVVAFVFILYLYYLGLMILMKVSWERVVLYLIAIVIISWGVAAVINFGVESLLFR